MDLRVNESLLIPSAELTWNFSRSAGPGGQHVNTSDSKAELSWGVSASRSLSAWQRQRLLEKLGSRLIAGALVVRSSEERSQWRNRQLAMEKMARLINHALAPDAPRRKATKPTKGSQRRRLNAKSNRSMTKELRRKPTQD
ncbi:alternative ribosome rescue aminoacyl-tRNA hydrolase ArfB [Arthrobacter sp. NIO-1057]|uniref:alternative ribosome rescue aminoacyl-tRNA hydrolase ArfB n=1 Tax=Arthrobacter sp. NIO-1057 TaxID=993071 RepID=UPI00071D9E5F|nr:alternative ribosome rescue aminoacyl-tRNA hydrolase ArfB [Arthrobacter sp. NIO-1057]KSU66442.1 peptide chain release factor 1 [Arthrobacter sp. NIO-1057]SCC14455.1 ribosome-associated protein [Arthrobacter sp. NIO-1057]